MSFKFFISILVLIVLCLTGCNSGSNRNSPSSNSSNNYLITPTGTYGVGFKDYDFINTNLCPDPLYSESTAQYFSPGNTNHCHQLAARVYYPILNKYESEIPYDPYYIDSIQQTVNQAFAGNIPESVDILTNKFSQISAQASFNAPLITMAKFPVIMLSPAFGISALDYQNTVLQLVSNGYIVVVVNSAFIATFQIPGNIVPPKILFMDLPHCVTVLIPGYETPICTESQARQMFPILNLSISFESGDINYTLNYFKNMANSDELASIMDFDHVGALGHSLGAQTVVKMAHTNHSLFQAAVAFDPFIQESMGLAPIDSFAIPFMIVDSAQIQSVVSGNLAINNYFLGLTPNKANITYSAHFNFIDMGTLQYTQLIPVLAAQYGVSIEDLVNVGTGDGYEIANNINTYLVAFFNMYLKNQQNQNLTNCTTLTNNTYILCNSGSYVPN